MLGGGLIGAMIGMIDQSLLVQFTPHDGGARTAMLFGNPDAILSISHQPTILGYVIFFGGLFAWRRWWWHADAFRPKQFRLTSVLLTAFLAWMWSMFIGFPIVWGVTWAAAISSVVQLTAAWIAPMERIQLIEGQRHVA